MMLGRDRESKIDRLKETLGACYNTFERDAVEAAIQLLESMTDEEYEIMSMRSTRSTKADVPEETPLGMTMGCIIARVQEQKEHGEKPLYMVEVPYVPGVSIRALGLLMDMSGYAWSMTYDDIRMVLRFEIEIRR